MSDRRVIGVLVIGLTGCAFNPVTLDPDGGGGDDDAPSGADGSDAAPDTSEPIAGCPASYTVDLTAGGFSKYRQNATALTWRAAQEACLADGVGYTGKTHLAVFGTDAERIATDTLLPGNTWIGLTDLATEDTFIWVTVEPDPPESGAPMWAGSNPDGADNDDCIRISNGWQYDDKSCTTSEKSVCECDDKPSPPSRYP